MLLLIIVLMYLWLLGENIITILPAISTEGMDKDSLPELIEKTRNIMQATYKEVSNEVHLTNKNNNYSKPKVN